MDYKILVTEDAKEDLDRFLNYLISEKRNLQAAKNLLDDFDTTVESLKYVAGSLKICDNPKLALYEYRRIHFLRHKYFMLYRIIGNQVYIDNIFHELQDYENIMQ